MPKTKYKNIVVVEIDDIEKWQFINIQETVIDVDIDEYIEEFTAEERKLEMTLKAIEEELSLSDIINLSESLIEGES